MELNAKNVDDLIKKCLFQDEEIIGGKPNLEPIFAQGITFTYGFHPRVNNYKSEIKELLLQLPKKFMKSSSFGGWSFLEAGITKDGKRWGEQPTVQHLVVMGVATGLVEYLTPKARWLDLPGGVPFFVVND